jgi:hypothetical protein
MAHDRLFTRSFFLAFALVSGCSASSACRREGHEGGGGGGSGGTHEPESVGTCTVAGVENAHRVEIVALPRECRWVGGFGETVLHDAAEYAAGVQCEGGVAPSVDFATNEIHVVRYSMSPAHAGRETLDDGTVVTFVTRFRHNCPDDPMPMPMDVTYGFLLPKGATRTYHEASCSLPENCP